jgi:hypothetical protein
VALPPQLVVNAHVARSAPHKFNRPVNMAVSQIAPPDGVRIVFLAADIGPRSLQQFHHSAETACAVQAFINARMIVNILAVNDSRPVDFVDGSLDFLICLM